MAKKLLLCLSIGLSLTAMEPQQEKSDEAFDKTLASAFDKETSALARKTLAKQQLAPEWSNGFYAQSFYLRKIRLDHISIDRYSEFNKAYLAYLKEYGKGRMCTFADGGYAQEHFDHACANGYPEMLEWCCQYGARPTPQHLYSIMMGWKIMSEKKLKQVSDWVCNAQLDSFFVPDVTYFLTLIDQRNGPQADLPYIKKMLLPLFVESMKFVLNKGVDVNMPVVCLPDKNTKKPAMCIALELMVPEFVEFLRCHNANAQQANSALTFIKNIPGKKDAEIQARIAEVDRVMNRPSRFEISQLFSGLPADLYTQLINYIYGKEMIKEKTQETPANLGTKK